MPGQQLYRTPYVVFEELSAAVSAQQKIDHLLGLPRLVDGIWQLTAGCILRHPAGGAFALAVTAPLLYLIEQGELVLNRPGLLGTAWAEALPVPMAEQIYDSDAARTYIDAFGLPGLIDGTGNIQTLEAANAVVERLVSDLNQNPQDLHSLPPRAFEALIAHLLHRDGFEVHLTPASGDGGIDILAVRNRQAGRFLLGVQCKRNALHRKIGVDLIREMVGTIDLEGIKAGAIVTTSYFTSGARALADRKRTQLSLQDFDDVRKWLLASDLGGGGKSRLGPT